MLLKAHIVMRDEQVDDLGDFVWNNNWHARQQQLSMLWESGTIPSMKCDAPMLPAVPQFQQDDSSRRDI